MIRIIEEIQTAQEAKEWYHDVVRNCKPSLSESVEAEPQDLPGDDCKIKAAKAAYRKLQSFNRADDGRQHKLGLA